MCVFSLMFCFLNKETLLAKKASARFVKLLNFKNCAECFIKKILENIAKGSFSFY